MERVRNLRDRIKRRHLKTLLSGTINIAVIGALWFLGSVCLMTCGNQVAYFFGLILAFFAPPFLLACFLVELWEWKLAKRTCGHPWPIINIVLYLSIVAVAVFAVPWNKALHAAQMSHQNFYEKLGTRKLSNAARGFERHLGRVRPLVNWLAAIR